jgi:Transposase zinc-binding domain/Putative transposase
VSRPAVEVADILHAQGDTFVEQHPWLSVQQRSVLRAIARCRTAALGGHLDRCDACGHQAISYNSCRHRHCPKCQAQARERWLHARERELLDVPYVHVVFTLPHGLLPLAYRNSARLYTWLFQASGATLREVAADSRHLGAEIGVLSILHTWGQTLVRHPHVHCVVPAGGLAPDRQRWIQPKYAGFFRPVKVLSRVFRGKFVAALRRRTPGTNSISPVPPNTCATWPSGTPSSMRSLRRTGSSTRSRPSAERPQYSGTSGVIPTAWRSAIIGYSRSTGTTSPRFSGRTTPTTTSGAR